MGMLGTMFLGIVGSLVGGGIAYILPPLSRNESEQFGAFRRNKIEQS
jgi:uncharacterized membrane protein YeaQ/YmgE (transglycosylase-associated protein family)